ncbi:Glutathione-regulated potassium-efflux system protein KefB [Candidatus Gugararchaeum adminiculabundum]|nr:Glutathione-regulated potassium-efflux system protein KefB [Candidatus Gugararchaeum adminiculabundum]
MAEAGILFDIGVSIVAATLLAYVTGILRQPTILAYIIAGMLIGPYGYSLVSNQAQVTVLSELGIALLLFIVGLEIDFKRLKDLGKVSLAVGGAQIFITGIVALDFALYMGYTNMQAFYLAAALVFSSTMIVVKLLADKNELDTLHGRISLGVLLLQDVVAILLLAVLPTLANPTLNVVGIALLKGSSLFIIAIIFGKFVLPWIFRLVASSGELLFLSALSWCLCFSYLAVQFGLSGAIGAFLAGVGLASTPYNLEIIGRVKSLRDFFATLFFVSLGMQISLGNLGQVIVPVIVFSLFVLVISPALVYFIGRVHKYGRKTSFLTGVALAQISEFSLILIGVGVTLGHVPQSFVPLIAAVAVITITISTYMITYGYTLYGIFSKALSLLNIPPAVETFYKLPEKLSGHIVLFGKGRTGTLIEKKLSAAGKKVIVVEFNPEIVKELIGAGKNCVYGDIADEEIWGRVGVDKAEIVISTIPDLQADKMLLKYVKKKNPRALIVLTSKQLAGAMELYNMGANYVLMPEFLAGEWASAIMEKPSREYFDKLRARHFEQLGIGVKAA